MPLPPWTKRWMREPLVHFLLGGLVLFLVFVWIGEPADPASRTIVITQEDRARMALQWERTMQRPPTDAELDSITETWLREEILYREALRLGLDRDDAVVRKRMANKMDFLAGSMAETAQPGEETLKAWLNDNQQRFARDTRYSFTQLYFAEKPDAISALARLSQGAQSTGLGETIALPRDVEAMPSAEIEKRFGIAFLEGVQLLERGKGWSQPLPSGFGWHLVNLKERNIGTVPELSEIRAQVLNDWRNRTLTQRRDDAYRLLRDSYEITVER